MSSKISILLIFAPLLCGCFEENDRFAWQPLARFDSEEIDESSGIVKSRRFEDVYWTHNDSGDEARIFAITSRGELIREVKVIGAKNVDWEDIAIDDAGQLYIGDTGNNTNDRQDLVIYVVPEPNPFESDQVSVLKRVPFSYPDQKAFPDRGNRNFDCEAIVWSEGTLYGLTKHRSDRRTKLYRFAPLEHDVTQTLTKISEFDVDATVTGTDVTPDGRKLLLLCYEYIYLFEKPTDSDDFLAGKQKRILFEGRQSEGICFTDGGEFLVTNEQREIYRLPESIFDLRTSFVPDLPQMEVPFIPEHTLDGQSNEWAGLKAGHLELRLNEITHKQGRICTRPTAQLARVADGLLLRIENWRPKLKKKKKTELLRIMVGSTGERTVSLQSGAAVWTLQRSKKGKFSFKQNFPDGPSSPAPQVQIIEKRNVFSAELFLPVQRATNGANGTDAVLFNLIVNPSSVCEWYWSTDSTTFSSRNPYLWGELSFSSP